MSIHPIPARLVAMARKFEELHAANNRLDFREGFAPKDSKCGSVACHGGWAGHVLSVPPTARRTYYERGADALGAYLFDDPKASGYHLLRWADKNPDLWGNPWGAKMFSSDGYFAFNIKSPAIGCTLLDIADHYREVAARIQGVRYVPE